MSVTEYGLGRPELALAVLIKQRARTLWKMAGRPNTTFKEGWYLKLQDFEDSADEFGQTRAITSSHDRARARELRKLCRLPIEETAEHLGINIQRKQTWDPQVKNMTDRLQERERQRRVAELRYRINMEISTRPEKPALVFETLTVDNNHIRQFEQQPNQISTHLKRVGRTFGTVRSGGPLNLRYVGGFELGDETLRPHWHFLWIADGLPQTVIPHFRHDQTLQGWPEWPLGRNDVLAVRYHLLDWYGRNHWPWPAPDGKDRVPSGLGAISWYVAKHQNKSLDLTWDRQRTKITRGFGLDYLTAQLQRRSKSWLKENLTQRPNRLTTLSHPVPRSLLVKRSRRELALRTPDAEAWKKVQEYVPLASIVKQYVEGLSTQRDHNFTEIGDSNIPALKNMAGYDAKLKGILLACQERITDLLQDRAQSTRNVRIAHAERLLGELHELTKEFKCNQHQHRSEHT